MSAVVKTGSLASPVEWRVNFDSTNQGWQSGRQSGGRPPLRRERTTSPASDNRCKERHNISYAVVASDLGSIIVPDGPQHNSLIGGGCK